MEKFNLGIYFLLFVFHNDAKEIRIGALLHDDTYHQAFQLAIQYVNENPQILPNDTLVGVGEPFDWQLSTFQLINKASELVQQGIIGIVGPEYTAETKASHPVSEERNIPQVTPMATDSTLSIDQYKNKFLLKMSSPDLYQSRAIMTLLEAYSWTYFAILCEGSDFGRNGVMEFARLAANTHRHAAAIEYFEARPIAKDIDVEENLIRIKRKGTRVIILNCHAHYASVIFEKAYEFGMLKKGWVWIVTNGVTAEEGLYMPQIGVPFKIRGLLGIKPTTRTGSLYYNFLYLWSKVQPSLIHQPIHSLVFDSVLTLAYGLHDYLKSGHDLLPPLQDDVSCSNNFTAWEQGRDFMEYLAKVSGPGATNQIGFTSAKYPLFTEYDIINLQKDGWEKAGHWRDNRLYLDPDFDVKFLGNPGSVPQSRAFSMNNITLRVGTVLSEPFVMATTERERALNPHVLYKGFCIDLLAELQKLLGFHSDLYLVPDGQVGTFDEESGTWDGLMKELIDGKADLALGSMTISHERQLYVDFSETFYNVGLGIVIAETNLQTSILAFLDPFEIRLWICVVAFCFVYGFTVSGISSISPYGWKGRYVQRYNKDDTSEQDTADTLNLYDSLWNSFAILTGQGASEVPTSFSGRIVAFSWFFAITVMLATYTANLAAFLTVQRIDTGIDSLWALAKQEDIKYGVVKDSTIEKFFSEQSTEPYRKMYKYMETHKTWFKSKEEAFEKVNASYGRAKGDPERYAFIHDYPYIEYKTNQPPCQTVQVGSLFHEFGYGIAFQKHSHLLPAFDLMIMQLKDNGFIDGLKEKWISSGNCHEEQNDSAVIFNQQTLYGMRGVFYLLICGILLGMICLVIEFIWAALMEAKKNQREGIPGGFTKAFCRRINTIIDDMRSWHMWNLCYTEEETEDKNHHDNNKNDLETMSPCNHCGYQERCVIPSSFEKESIFGFDQSN